MFQSVFSSLRQTPISCVKSIPHPQTFSIWAVGIWRYIFFRSANNELDLNCGDRSNLLSGTSIHGLQH